MPEQLGRRQPVDGKTEDVQRSDRATLNAPGREAEILLHSCCAPCAGDVMNEITRSGIDYTVLFYNPNIHPRKEYELRKEENKRYADKLNAPFVDLDYDRENWFKHERL